MAAAVRHYHRLDGRTAWRQFVDNRYIQVGISAHRQCAWNGRGRHDELVRRDACGFALLSQREALVDPKTVLLVDDRKPQPMKGNIGLKQRMSANNHLCVTAFDHRFTV